MFNLDAVLAACPGGGPDYPTVVALQQAAGVRPEGESIGEGQALAIWATVLLLDVTPKSAAQSVFNFMSSVHARRGWGHFIPEIAADDKLAPVLLVTGSTHLGVTDIRQVWELGGKGRWVDAVPPGWLESRVFNLRTFYRNRAALAQKATPCTTTPQPPSGPTPTPPPSV